MKQQFIENLKNGRIPAAQSRKELEELTVQGENFFPLTENIKAEFKSPAYWGSNAYFFGKFNLLSNNFSIELCEHLIQVKERLQQLSTQGFDVEENTEEKQNSSNFFKKNSTVRECAYSEPDLSNYVPNMKLKNYLQAGDIPAIQAFLSAELVDFRLTIEELIKTVFFIEKNKKDVFKEYKTSAFIAEIESDETKWNARYFDKQQGDLNQNFALERFFHLINVRETLMIKGEPDFQQIKVELAPLQQQLEISNKHQAEPLSSPSITKPMENNRNFRVLAAILAAGGLVVLALWKLIR